MRRRRVIDYELLRSFKETSRKVRARNRWKYNKTVRKERNENRLIEKVRRKI